MKAIRELADGLQHIGVPAKDLQESVAFYESLGFVQVWPDKADMAGVAFLRLGSCVIETYAAEQTAKCAGAVDHIALNVCDIEAAFAAVRAGGYRMLDESIQALPFYQNGVRYFTILGPNEEKIEFNQIL